MMTDCLQKKRKPLMPTKTLDIIFRRRHLKNTQFYFANRKHAVSDDKPKQKPGRSYQIPKSEKLLSYIKYSDHKEKINTKNRLNQPLTMAAVTDFSERLFLEEPPDDVRAVVEIHPEFYTVIEGRPLRSFDDIKLYTSNIRSYAMNRQQIGYRRDLIMKLEQSNVDESVQYEQIVEDLRQHIKNFQKFLTEDYKKACSKVATTEKVAADLVAINSEILGYISQLTILNNMIFKLDAIRSVLKIYRSYLLFVAPLSWRQKYDETLKDKIASIQFEAGQFATDNDLVESMDIDKMVELARHELTNPLPAYNYFDTPEQMIYIFRTMELQSREYLTELAKTDAPFRRLVERVYQLKKATRQELDYFQYYIDRINAEISRELYNETYLQEKFFRILLETFYESVACPLTLKLKICIEYVYEQVFGKCEEGHHSLMDPMKILEVMYEDYNLRMDSLDFTIVKKAQSDLFAQDLKMLKLAYLAQRELRSFREMTNAMNKAFLPPHNFKKPVLKKFMDKETLRAHVLAEKKKLRIDAGIRVKAKKYKLSPEEQDGLVLFTDWCEGTNPAPYLRDYNLYVKPVFARIASKPKKPSY